MSAAPADTPFPTLPHPDADLPAEAAVPAGPLRACVPPVRKPDDAIVVAPLPAPAPPPDASTADADLAARHRADGEALPEAKVVDEGRVEAAGCATTSQRNIEHDELAALMRIANPEWDQQMLAAWGAELCAKCGAPIPAGDPVWIDTYPGYLKAAICRRCIKLFDHQILPVGPCDGGCGREVHVSERTDRLHLFCSRRCEIRFYSEQRKENRARQRRRRCIVCDELFEPRRAGARTCSSACRQRAYRQRKGAKPRARPSNVVESCPEPATVTQDEGHLARAYSRELRLGALDSERTSYLLDRPAPRPEKLLVPPSAATLRKGHKTRDLVAAYVSARTGQRISGRTFDKLNAVCAAAKANPERFGEIAKEMDDTGRVNGAYEKLQRAIVKAAIEVYGFNTAAATTVPNRPFDDEP